MSNSCASPSRTRRQLIQALGLSVLVPAAYPVQAELALSTAINRAGRFRALSQRCAKAYCQLSLEVLPDSAQDILITAQRLIQVGLEDLSKGTYPAAVSQQIVAVRLEALALTKLLQAKPTQTSVANVSAQADKMLAEADKATAGLEGQAPQPSAKLVNVAGRQRMLSQRLAKNYFLSAAGLETKFLRDQMAQDKAAFVQALAALNAAPLSTPHIRNELELAQNQWLLFERALGRKPDPAGLATVATASERLLEVMNNLAVLYEVALKDLLGQV